MQFCMFTEIIKVEMAMLMTGRAFGERFFWDSRPNELCH